MNYSVQEMPEQVDRQWVGLTDLDIEAAFYHAEYDTTFSYQLQPAEWCKAFAQHIESQLRSKNT